MTDAKKFAIEVVDRLRSAGFEALWAGGCVRDLLMEHEPEDYDVATSATPQQVRELFGFRRTLMVGAAFGVVIVRGSMKSEGQVEVATFRTDASYSDGRRPDSVTFSTPEQDALRRDFTINGMFYDPINCDVIDYVGGREDLRNGVIRAIGDPHARLNEDKLRMLRAVRFAARFSFEIESQTLAAITVHAPDSALVSGERIAVEFRKTLQTNRAAWAVATLHKTGLLKVILPEVSSNWHEIGELVCELIESCPQCAWLSRAAATCWPLVDTEGGRTALPVNALVASLKSRLRLANEEADALHAALDSQAVLMSASRIPWSRVQPLLIRPHILTALQLLNARSVLVPQLTHEVAWLRDRLKWQPEKLNPPPLLDGRDLHRNGLQPGPLFRKLLQEARDLQLNGVLTDRIAASAWLVERCRSVSTGGES